MPPDPPTITRDGPPMGLSVWLCAEQPAWLQRRGRYVTGSGAHPARMLPTVAEHAIRAYTAPGDLVIDPLAGVGTTLLEATHLGRDAIGIEYEPGWAALAAANLRHATDQGATGRGIIVAGDATRLPNLLPSKLWGQADIVLTSPPYGRTIHGRVEHRRGPLLRFANQYGEPDRTSLAHRGLGGIRDGLATILAGCLPLLRPGGVVAVTARPWRRAGLLVDLPGAVGDAALATGLHQSSGAWPCWPPPATDGCCRDTRSGSSPASVRPAPTASRCCSSRMRTCSCSVGLPGVSRTRASATRTSVVPGLITAWAPRFARGREACLMGIHERQQRV